jgi:hypothetical protein
MIATNQARTSTALAPPEIPAELIEQLAERRIASYGSYAHCFRDVGIRFQNGVLTLTGTIATYYLKQVLQTLLKHLDGVSRIDNQVEVANFRGLNSIRPR